MRVGREDLRILNVRGGARMCVPADLDNLTAYILLEQEDWFEDEIRFVRRWLRPGMHAVDVGANLGIYTTTMALAVGRDGRIWAYEPTPQSADILQRTLDLNQFGQVSVHRAAASDRGGSVAFSIMPASEMNAVAPEGENSGEVIRVAAVTLDQAAAEHDWSRVALVKLDVEGHELAVVEGATRFLKSASPLLMFEIKAGAYHDLRPLAPLAEIGYGFYRLVPQMSVMTPFDPQEPLDGYQLNLFACKEDRRAELVADGFLAATDAVPVETPEMEAWNAYARTTPYARQLAAQWPSRAGFFSGAGLKAYLRGLAAFARSRDPKRRVAERLKLVRRALECVAEALECEDTLPRRISFARLAWEVGMRGAAVISFEKAAQRVKTEIEQACAEPFLAPSPRYEQIAAEVSLSDWLECAVTEQHERLRAFSSVFVGTSSISVLEPISASPYRSPEMERRRQLVRMRAGFQSAPEPVPLLCARTEENLNPEFWCGAGAG